jgi:hypothetical protein
MPLAFATLLVSSIDVARVVASSSMASTSFLAGFIPLRAD